MASGDEWVVQYLKTVAELFATGHAREHAYRPALQALLQRFDDVTAVNDPKRSEHGNPDFILLKTSNSDIVLGHAEAKDVDVALDKVEGTEQMERYAEYQNLMLTDYLEFRFYQSGAKHRSIRIASLNSGKIVPDAAAFGALVDELRAFVSRPPESIKSGARLAQIMGLAARRLRNEVIELLASSDRPNDNLQSIFQFIKKELLHDLDEHDFADMYAQTLVYGLFVARYNDSSPETFSRAEARDLIPVSNPFLREFFDHIAGTKFERDLAYAVDELCQVFRVSDVTGIVRKHIGSEKPGLLEPRDPIIHFYEDFLEAYDPSQRKRLGAYYTPLPVVRFIVREVDRVLREKLGVAGGLKDAQLLDEKVDFSVQGKRVRRSLHRVQVLDPAVGTATFLNEVIRHVHESFVGQEGRWPSYLAEDLLPRLHGFEIMMAPYTVAHLKLSMTLDEFGFVPDQRLGVYLTNALEEGDAEQPNLLQYLGLGDVITEESRRAAEIKHRYPIMVVMGNPPYSGVSVNQTKYANGLIAKYKFEPGTKQKLQEKKHRLDDDYVKFMAFAEDLILKRGEGVMALIVNHGFVDNASFRGMRWHLLNTFDEISVYDLHGNITKREKAPDGSPDENVFAIKQGVCVIVASKYTSKKAAGHLADVAHADLWGTKESKFQQLNEGVSAEAISPTAPLYLFNARDLTDRQSYLSWVRVDRLFPHQTSGVQTSRDHFAVGFGKAELQERFEKFVDLRLSDDEAREQFFGGATSRKYPRGDTRGWKLPAKREAIAKRDLAAAIVPYGYRPFDTRFLGEGPDFVDWPRTRIMQHMLRPNVALVVGREGKAVGNGEWSLALVQDHISDLNLFYRGGGVVMPLWIYHGDEIDANIDATLAQQLVKPLKDRKLDISFRDGDERVASTITPIDLLDYTYAVLHSPAYRAEFKEFLDTDFPRIPAAPDSSSFDALVDLGRELRVTHLMTSRALESLVTAYPVAGSDIVELVRRDDEGRVWISNKQYFGGVPDDAWELRVGGYQPAEKWLKDRIGRKLSGAEIDHYERLIAVNLRTVELTAEIGKIPLAAPSA